MAQKPRLETFDLLVKWPPRRSLRDLDKRRTFPIPNYPRRWNLKRRVVWVSHNHYLVRRLHISRISGPTGPLEMAAPGFPSMNGYRLYIDAVTVPTNPQHLGDVCGSGWAHTFPHPATLRYLRPKPLEVVLLGASHAALSEPFRTPVENLNVEFAEVEDQCEHLSRFDERRLVLDYQSWIQRLLDAWWIPSGQTTIRSDAFDEQRNLLIEAKAHAERPSLRMAVGQLWDYARHLEPEPQLAVLTPEKPDKQGLEFLKYCHVGSIWRTADGFTEKLVKTIQ